MKNIKYIFFLMIFQTVLGQNTEENWNTVYKNSITEKVYLHLNNVLYEAGETVYFKGYIAESSNIPSTLSGYLYVDVFDGANKKILTQNYNIDNANIEGSYSIPEGAASGMYKIKAYTKVQNEIGENVFEKNFFVQKVVSPRILMTLDFTKKAYGKGEICEANFELKNLESQAIKNYAFEYDIFVDGKKINSLQGKTDDLGKAVVVFKLPNDLKSNDGILNVMLDYDNFKESVTRSIPINLKFIDLQFLPESGNLVLNEASSLFFIAKNEFGLPMDVAGFIEDEKGNRVSDFKSIHDGMGNVILKTMKDKKYFAVVTSPFQSKEKIALPSAINNLFVLNAKKNPENVVLNIYAPLAIPARLLVRNTAQIYQTTELNLTQGWNSVTVKTEDLPVGIYSFSLLVKNEIVAERLVFLNYQDGLKIEIKTDKEIYLPREKVKVSILTKDKNNTPIASNLSVSVVDSKLLTYIDDKQDNLLTWFYLGFELKGKIYEPRFYFDENKKLEDREQGIDLLLNTYGWRKYDQKNLQDLLVETSTIKPETTDIIEGFVLNHKDKPVRTKVLFLTDQGKVFETKSNSSGYFRFHKVSFSDLAYLVAEGKRKEEYTIKNSFTNENEFAKMKDTLSNLVSDNVTYKYTNKKESGQIVSNTKITGNSVSLDTQQSLLNESIVVGYGTASKKNNTTGSCATLRVQYEEIASNILNGRITGVQVTSASGQVGSADKVMIRGAGSIYGSRAGGQPLIVIDGIPYANNESSSFLGSIPVNSIESISILKDASASALYGLSGAYGVVLINTKSRLYQYQGNQIFGKKHTYTFQNIWRSGKKALSEAEYFYAPKYKSVIVEEKTDFRSCIYWNSIIHTNKKGEANFEFHNSDDNTSFKILAEGTSYKGHIGKSEAFYAVKELIQTDVKVPVYASQDDVILIPVWLKNNSEKSLQLRSKLEFNKQNVQQQDSVIHLKPNESKTIYLSLFSNTIGKKLPLEITLTGENLKSKIKKTIDIYSKGFPVNIDISGSGSQVKDFVITEPLPGTIDSGFKLFYNPFSSIFDILEGMMSEPHGCFEQVSSTNYPNIMAMQLLEFKKVSPEFKEKVLKFLNNGYQKLKNYESKDGGFEWYGGNPGNEALTAYGLLQFNEMKNFINVDKKLVERSIKWLNSRKDNKGGFKQNPGRYGFSGIRYEVNNAYIVYVLSEIGETNIEKEYQTALQEALKSNDLYRMNLLALSSFNLKKYEEYKQLMQLIRAEVKRLGFKELRAEQSVINSYGKSMNIEIVSLFTLALLKDLTIRREVMYAIDYIQASKTSYGFGSTQATALALKCITECMKINNMTSDSFFSEATMSLNNESIDLTQKDKNGNVILKDLKANLGSNNFSIKMRKDNYIPYLFYVQYQTYRPNNSEECKLVLNTKTANKKVKISETARIEIQIQNKSKQEVSNPIARIGIPGGLTPEPWQLKELTEKNIVDFYEILGNELVLYFRKLNSMEIRNVNIDLKAIIPGNYKAVASSAYLYYENEHRNWNSGLEIEVLK
ncbi:hypothetical protein B4N84_11225 [Flavobacterium sp. IR1]|nr:hypothetical protein B4N84_11225 [Flavobacterium sp. IR1]